MTIAWGIDVFLRCALTLLNIQACVSERERVAYWVKVNCGRLISQGSLLLASSANLMQWSVAAATAGNSFGGRGYSSYTYTQTVDRSLPSVGSWRPPHTHFHLINFIIDEHPKTCTSIIPWHYFREIKLIYEMTSFGRQQILHILSLAHTQY